MNSEAQRLADEANELIDAVGIEFGARHRAKELVARLAALHADQRWQPIETAPKDETVLLAAEFDGPGDWRVKAGYFYSEIGQWRVWGASWKPSHWMPLPDAPSATPVDAVGKEKQ